MKKVIVLLTFIFAANVSAQTQYEKGMTKAMQLWEAQKINEAIQLFERIATAEKDNWLPPYYAATLEIISSFGVKDEALLSAKLTRAKTFLDNANIISKDNPEIMIRYALLNTAYIAYDGQKYGMKLSGENTAIYKKAAELAPNNPRVILAKAEWEIGSAKFFGQSTEPYCKDVKRSIDLFKKEKQTIKFYPVEGIERAKEVLKECKNPSQKK